jgi:hypothetical protein
MAMADTPTKTPQSPPRAPAARPARQERDLRDRLGIARAGPQRAEQPSLVQRLIDGLKTFVWVAPLTILIWIYAEREQIAQLNDVPVPIEVRTAAADRVVLLVSPEDRRLLLDLQGPRAALTKVRDALLDRRASPIPVLIPEDLAPGAEYEIPVAERLHHNDLFTAVTITRARPSLRVRVEPKVSREVPVRVRPEEKIVGKVDFTPATIIAEGPAYVFANIPADRLVAYADMQKFVGRPPGHHEGYVPISLSPRAENITMPQSVHVSVDIRRSEEEKLSIPLRVDIPSAILRSDRYTIEAPVTLANVPVAGPPEAVQAMREGKFSPAAIIELTDKDFEAPGEKIKRLRPDDYRMPRDVTVTEAEREVTITITRRGG